MLVKYTSYILFISSKSSFLNRGSSKLTIRISSFFVPLSINSLQNCKRDVDFPLLRIPFTTTISFNLENASSFFNISSLFTPVSISFLQKFQSASISTISLLSIFLLKIPYYLKFTILSVTFDEKLTSVSVTFRRVISDHLHENAGKEDKIGKTKVINPGPFGKILHL